MGPPTRFEASKLKVVLTGQEKNKYEEIVPRTYTLSHCDLTANLTLTISNAINLDQVQVPTYIFLNVDVRIFKQMSVLNIQFSFNVFSKF